MVRYRKRNGMNKNTLDSDGNDAKKLKGRSNSGNER